jgi:quercetin dioxygenase-like cupin family protein
MTDLEAKRVAAVDGQVALRYEWGTIQWLCSGERLPDARMTFGYVEIAAGAKNPRHYHPNSDEVLYVIEGELDHSLGDVVYHLTPGMAIHIPQGVVHDARNTAAGVARVVIAYSTGDRQVVMLEGGHE